MSDILQTLNEEKVFKDPVHRYVHVKDQLIWELINTPEFQRLRRIRQLGTTYVTFHGAEHSRFNHSLGVYEVMRRIIEQLKNKAEWTREDRLLCLSAALLHDVGHGPFSHSFEKVFHTDHEEWTQEILLGDTTINKILRKVGEDFPLKVSEVIDKTSDNKLVVSLISSQIDADRMDYLLRDAYFTGVNYGNFDMERILRVIRPHEEYAVIKYSGMHAVEDYIMSRYQMYWQVYFHPVTRSSEVILRKIFQRAAHLYEQGYPFKQNPDHLIPLMTKNVSLKAYLKLDESVVMYYFQIWMEEDDNILKDLCQRFMDRQLFKYIEYLPTANADEDVYAKLKQLFLEVGIDTDYYLVADSSSDLPYDFYRPGEEGERIPINLLMPNGELKELSKVSDIVQAITGKTRTDHKLYYAQELIEEKAQHKQYAEKVVQIKRLLGISS
ncbi:HD domain-containing protein [Bacillus horti]|uniref:HD superfamily phosphohydrolase n=1 Tax=Caldalkalibacillus horti TaxID=77523 RepID=A0ABT9VVT6_9BACI|nr:HD domain-containing protein [Bacillus horti]MDQ0165086.1 HD superfamily phosphohydrolase [Bacillus horti]